MRSYSRYSLSFTVMTFDSWFCDFSSGSLPDSLSSSCSDYLPLCFDSSFSLILMFPTRSTTSILLSVIELFDIHLSSGLWAPEDGAFSSTSIGLVGETCVLSVADELTIFLSSLSSSFSFFWVFMFNTKKYNWAKSSRCKNKLTIQVWHWFDWSRIGGQDRCFLKSLKAWNNRQDWDWIEACCLLSHLLGLLLKNLSSSKVLSGGGRSSRFKLQVQGARKRRLLRAHRILVVINLVAHVAGLWDC